MYKQSKLVFGIGLSSLAIAVSLVGATAITTVVIPQSAIAESANVGGSVAKKLQGKPVVVEIHASWCPACKNIAPTLSQLKQDYEGKANFIVLDVSDRSKTKKSEQTAKELGLGKFFAANKSQTGMVAIIDPANGNILAQHRNNANLKDYSLVLNAAISR
jgi:thiol-disulfide isomerase/thioredoxin